MQVKEIMTTDPACCTAGTILPEVARMMIDYDCGQIPVINNKVNRVPVGVVTDRDIVCRTIAKGLNPLELTVADCMTEPCVSVTPEMTLEECCRVLEANQIRRVPVVDAHGSCCGIVALADIALQTKEKVAGDVVKEVSAPSAAASAAGR